ncbi:polysaccharide deacetylase family protein [Noviherbaspirillum cavernae]|uniref:Polysaccharide deacetylase family protein n=1 Tax=Noviherbaspirillum cavernae TaxID=2320862 RepID=A0A418X5R0_9BURK|nr:polysaccharide deacetylase family protein [Noviherbaspirillum cavernae]RJG07701.1 polysaccharide deacetylase family protein [Noviherbaspirillum cavernae]
MTQNPPIRWRMPLLVRLTLALHAAMLAVVIVAPQLWPWVLAALVANHALITAVGLWPRSTWLGANWTRLPAASAARGEIALTIDDGPNPEVTPQVLDMLDRYGVKATFFCIGEHALRHPDLCQAIVARGHAVENHSQHHRHHFSVMGMAGLTREIAEAQATLSRITGHRPLFFRAPAGLRNPFLDPVLARLGLRLAAWTRRGYDTRTADADAVSRRLLPDVKAGAILLLHDGNCARTAAGVPVILAVLPRLIEAAHGAGLHFVTLPAALQSANPTHP